MFARGPFLFPSVLDALQFLQAGGADVLSLKGDDVPAVLTEDAGGLIFLQDDLIWQADLYNSEQDVLRQRYGYSEMYLSSPYLPT